MSIKIKRNGRGHDYLYVDGKRVEYINSPNQSGTIKPKYLVIHFTAGETLDGSVNWFKQKRAKASSQLVLGTDGEWVQMTPLNAKAWHAGKSQWDGIRYLNGHSIGIEVVNPGPMVPLGDDRYKAWWGKVYDKGDYPDIIEARHPNGGPVRGWLPFTPAQHRQLIEVGSALMDHYDLRESVGHDMISPRRKTDPGPAMESSVYGYLNGRLEDEETDVIYEVFNTGSGLNARKGPHHTYSAYDFGPIPDGTKVTREEVHGDTKWWLVRGVDSPNHEYWVHANWIRRAD